MYLSADGSVVFSDANTARIRRLGQVFLGDDANIYQIPSNDGSEIYQFSITGRHLKTLFAKTGKTKWQFDYSADGFLQRILDADNRPVDVARDAQGRALSMINKYSQSVGLTADVNGWLTSLQLPPGDAYNFAYSRKGLLSQFSKPDGTTSTFVFDASGNLIQDTDAAGATKSLSRSALSDGYVGVLTYPDGTTTSATGRSVAGATRISELTGRDGIKTTYQRSVDFLQDNLKISSPDGYVETTENADPRLGGASTYNTYELYRYSYKGNGLSRQVVLDQYDPNNLFNFKEREIVTQDAGAPQAVRTYDSSTKLHTLMSAGGRLSYLRIDDQERPVTMQTGTLLPVNLTYDSFGHVSKMQQGGRVTLLTYDGNGFLSSITDPLLRQHTMQNDLVGRVTSSTTPAGETLKFGYDKNDNLISLQPFGKAVHQLVYNIVGLLSVYNPPTVNNTASSESYIYNQSRDLQKMIQEDGQEIVYGYDSTKARVTTMTLGAQQITFGYEDVLGNINRFTNSANGQVTQIAYVGTRPSNWIEAQIRTGTNSYVGMQTMMSYDVMGRPSQIFLLSNADGPSPILYKYDADNLLISAGSLSLTRSAQTGLVASTALDSLRDQYTYNDFGELISYNAGFYAFSLTRDAIGRVIGKSETTSAGTKNYEYIYDGNDRLTGVKKDGVVATSYTYDGNGNRLMSTMGSGTTTSSIYDAQDRIVSRGSVQYQFNRNGQLVQKTDGTQITKYQYDIFGQLVTVNLPSGKTIDYIVNGLGQRIGKKVDGVIQTLYQYQSKLQVVAEISPSGAVTASYVYGMHSHSPDYMEKSGVRYRFVKDQIGSVRMVVNATDGSVAQQLDYDEWGNVLSNTAPGFQPFGFAGGLYDKDTQLILFGARNYDPETGRWTSKDPFLFNGGDTNLYGYVANDPVNGFDPLGLWAVTIGGNIGGYLGGGYDVSGGIYVGYQNGNLLGGLFGSGSTGFGYGAGIGVQGTYYSDASNVCGSSTNYNGNIPIPGTALGVSGTIVTSPQTGQTTGYGLGLGVGSPRGGSITFGNTGTLGFSVPVSPVAPSPVSHMRVP